MNILFAIRYTIQYYLYDKIINLHNNMCNNIVVECAVVFL